MTIHMNARCDFDRCKTIQPFSLDSAAETGDIILNGLRQGGWKVEGTFNGTPGGVKLTCPFCMKQAKLPTP